MQELTPESLQGGQLEAVVKARMLTDPKVRARFEKKLAPQDRALLEAYERAYGWRPPAELVEWAALAPGYRAVLDDVSDVWMVGGGIDHVAGKHAPRLERLVHDHDGLLTLLCGLELFGHDPSGDRCFASSLPHPRELAEVHVYNHENGELDGDLYHSIADFVFSCWAPEDEDGERDEAGDRRLQAAFHRERETARRQLAVHADGRALFGRMKWLWSLPTGEPGYRFAEDMQRAPTFADYERERELLPRTPVLANYWLLAHYFLGNLGACAEAAALARQAPGTLTPALAQAIQALLDRPAKAKLGKLQPGVLAELRQAVRKNADGTLLEPEVRAALERERRGGAVRADPGELGRRLRAGEDGWALIAELADDVEAHDLVLAELAGRDAALAKTVERYHRARAEEDAWKEWPSRWEEEAFDRRLAPVVGAAFRAGLRFDSDHQRAASSLVNTLAFLDDAQSMDSFAAAIEALRMDDERLEYVVSALVRSRQPAARGLLVRAAWRFFDFFDATVKAQTKREADRSIDTLFQVDNHLLPALLAAIRAGDEASEKLVDKVLSITDHMSVLGVAYAEAFRQVGEKKLTRHVQMAAGYCMLIDGFTGECLPGYAHYNFAEAALACARINPPKAEQTLRGIVAREREPTLCLDVVGGALAGLLALAPDDAELVAWADRILANRTGEERVYGALRGVAAGQVRAARGWIRPHAYTGTSSNHILEHALVQEAARDALVALGEPAAPPFDEADEFASGVPRQELPAALRQRHKHLTEYVFKRIREAGLRSPEVIEIGGEVLRDAHRFSADEGARARSVEERKAGLQAMLAQGPACLPMLASLLGVEGVAGSRRTIVLYVMGMIAEVPALFARLRTTPAAEVRALLEAPTPEAMGLLDLVAGWALATQGEEAHAALERAAAWRLSLYGGEYDHWAENEPTGPRLARLLARAPAAAARVAERVAALGNYHVSRAWQPQDPPAPLAGLGDAAEITLGMSVASPGCDGPRYTCALRLSGAEVALTYLAEDISCEGILDERRYEQAGVFTAGSPEEARAAVDGICRALAAVGFAPPAARKAVRGGKSAKAARKGKRA
ncbi:MAG TPA: hypothetical protein PK668_21660 [Myxococcota bacterium]|nr:hypothetical protein [Myxococcota bacterium]HRY96086.1 hypothetical protein [Myxococcota bacterium]HSA21603.1 hypothetical protein [Myxococcota bacterium]